MSPTDDTTAGPPAPDQTGAAPESHPAGPASLWEKRLSDLHAVAASRPYPNVPYKAWDEFAPRPWEVYSILEELFSLRAEIEGMKHGRGKESE